MKLINHDRKQNFEFGFQIWCLAHEMCTFAPAKLGQVSIVTT